MGSRHMFPGLGIKPPATPKQCPGPSRQEAGVPTSKNQEGLGSLQ